MAIKKRFLSLALTLCVTPVFLSAVPLPAGCEVSASPHDPGFLWVPNATCNTGPNASTFKCTDGTCSEIAEYTFDVNGQINLTIAGHGFTITGNAGEKTWTSGKFNSAGNNMHQCAPSNPPLCGPPSQCQSHGIGCGAWSIYTGKDCAFPAGTDFAQGWATGCG